jgi:hypothetical protein
MTRRRVTGESVWLKSNSRNVMPGMKAYLPVGTENSDAMQVKLERITNAASRKFVCEKRARLLSSHKITTSKIKARAPPNRKERVMTLGGKLVAEIEASFKPVSSKANSLPS